MIESDEFKEQAMNSVKYVPASVEEKAFNCPHCRALTTQHWHSVGAIPLKDGALPEIITIGGKYFRDIEIGYSEGNVPDYILEHVNKMASGQSYIEKTYNHENSYRTVYNISISECYNCHQVSFWKHNQMIWPIPQNEFIANPDLPEEIRLDFDEASKISNISPRGSAALLRLCIQKLCKHIGEKGNNINDDIANLVKNGLSSKIQKALDIVRVIGNEAVHPGQIDLKDDHSTAHQLFDLVNIIADVFITQPKRIDDLYNKLPASKIDGINQRDKKSA